MKRIIILLIFTVLISCGKSTYYAFEEYDYDPDSGKDYLYSYCALEITPKKEVIFRGSSRRYVIEDKKTTYFDDNSSSYIYIAIKKQPL
ncbi:hypothetical protein GSQ57_01595 [Flavobacterium columnare]|uniref:hypothetical protein n=1 Tax=Flavobacterium columnare TaxID=996 RepID=UPI001781D407|nr:hypothetical protein [Flavobacterium columnare]QOH23388.1 hypothetical protein GSQ57_01595 [Flavobacterium columnare]